MEGIERERRKEIRANKEVKNGGRRRRRRKKERCNKKYYKE
jgi:hypothetical protein